VRGDHDVNEPKLAKAAERFLGEPVRVAMAPEALARQDEFAIGFVGPHALVGRNDAFMLVDPDAAQPGFWAAGANETDHHAKNVVLGRDFTPTQWGEIAIVEPGDPCPRCASPLRIDRGIEVGHVFQLGTKYTDALGGLYTDENGEQHPMIMGCYGIGVSRIVTAVAEEFHDEHGLAWPMALAPFKVHVIAMPGDESAAAAVKFADELAAAGVDVLFDDREGRPGVKFADADLIGMPMQVIVGSKGIAKGIVERKWRATGERDELPLDTAVATIVTDVNA
jgi:prolyl-tRNA synthetase